MINREINKSKIYILPLLYYRYNLFDIRCITNTYLYSNIKSEDELFIIEYDKKLIDQNKLTEYINSIEEFNILFNHIYKDDKLYMIYKIDKHIYYAINCLVNGKYSYMLKEDKYKIMSFMKLYSNQESCNIIGGILYKTKSRKAFLENTLDVKLDDDAEFASVPNIKNETINFSLYE